jgi:hypothetical protein
MWRSLFGGKRGQQLGGQGQYIQVGGRSALVRLQILWRESSMFRKASKYAWAEFFIIVEGKHDICPSWAFKRFVRSCDPFDTPPDAQEGC